jgi:hypothetical protein
MITGPAIRRAARPLRSILACKENDPLATVQGCARASTVERIGATNGEWFGTPVWWIGRIGAPPFAVPMRSGQVARRNDARNARGRASPSVGRNETTGGLNRRLLFYCAGSRDYLNLHRRLRLEFQGTRAPDIWEDHVDTNGGDLGLFITVMAVGPVNTGADSALGRIAVACGRCVLRRGLPLTRHWCTGRMAALHRVLLGRYIPEHSGSTGTDK